MIPTLYEPFRHWSEGGSVFILSDFHFDDSDCKHINLAANVCGYTSINLGKLIKDGVLSDIEGIHRKTIDKATARKEAGMSMKDYDMRLAQLTEMTAKMEFRPRDPERIPGILAELEKTWNRYPDLRLGQLIMDIVPNDSLRFNIEDDKMLEAIRAFGCRGSEEE